MSDLRITGLATGLDVDSLVQQMMRVENMRLDKMEQDRQILEWRQELYRDIMGDLNTFKSTYFDVLNRDTYMLSGSNFSSFNVVSSDATNAVTASASTGAAVGNYKISVSNLAEKAEFTGGVSVNVKEAPNSITFPINIGGSNNELTVDGTNTINLTQKVYNNLSELTSEINNKLTSSSDVYAEVKDNEIIFLHKVSVTAGEELTVNVDGQTHTVKMDEDGNYTMNELLSKVNSKLSSQGIKAEIIETAAADGSITKRIAVKDSTGSYVDFTGGNVTASSATVSSTVPTDTAVYSTPATNQNRLSYNRAILTGINDKLVVEVGGTSHEVDISGVLSGVTASDTDDAAATKIAANLNTLLSTYGVNVEKSQNGKLLFKAQNTNDQIIISGNGTGTLGIPNYFEVGMSSYDKMSNIVSGSVEFTVNNHTFQYNFDSETDSGTVIGAKNMSIKDIMNDISTKANVNMTYSELTRKFTLTSNDVGEAQVIVNTQDKPGAGSFLQTLFGQASISDAAGYLPDGITRLQGKDAKVTITEPGMTGTGITITKPTNSFTIDGVKYTLNSQPAGEVTFTITSDPSKTYDKIKGFVDKYNEVIDKINAKISEKKQYSYLPLTDEQKKEMSEDEIKKWEEKAKEGLLKGDNTLESMLSAMRRAFYDPVKSNYNDSGNIGISLTDIGLSTSNDTSQRGKIIIDEKKLKEAIETKGDMVAELFTKVSSSVSRYSPDLTADERDKRYKEEGIFQRISDILQDNLRTTRNSYGKKGLLLEKAGIEGDFSEFNNILSDQLREKDRDISDLNLKLIEKENRYYQQFAQLEKAIQKMNEQSSWLMQQFGS